MNTLSSMAHIVWYTDQNQLYMTNSLHDMLFFCTMTLTSDHEDKGRVLFPIVDYLVVHSISTPCDQYLQGTQIKIKINFL